MRFSDKTVIVTGAASDVTGVNYIIDGGRTIGMP